VPRKPVELVVDLEGIPDRSEYYLAGLLVCSGDRADYEPFWADDADGEGAMWSALVERLESFPDSPIYHYASYEKKAFVTLAKRHGRGSGLADRLVNVASFVYGRVNERDVTFPYRGARTSNMPRCNTLGLGDYY
jgi:uncharacterized protein